MIVNCDDFGRMDGRGERRLLAAVRHKAQHPRKDGDGRRAAAGRGGADPLL